MEMASDWRTSYVARAFDINIGEAKDPRVGSTRDGASDNGTLSQTSGNKSSSLQSLGATFIPVVIYATVCIIIFTILRRRCPRVYAPRTLSRLREPHTPTPALPSGWFDWVKPFFNQSDTFVLNHGSIDGFFFLRYLKILRNIFFIGICISWPILFPVHITGGNKLSQLDMLTLGNVAQGDSFFAHIVVAYLFFGFVLYTVIRECIYYINIRQAYLSSPHYANRLSSKTVLLTSVPKPYLDEARLRKLYGDSVKRIWIPRTAKALVKLVKEREQTAMRLEKAEIELIKKANFSMNKQMRGRPPVSTSSSAEECTADSSRESRTASRESVTTTGNDTIQHEIHGPRRVNVNVTIEDPDVDHEVKSEGTQITQLPGDSPIIGQKLEDPEYVHPYGLNADLPDVRGSVAAQWMPAEARPHHRPIGNFGRRVDTIRWTRTRLRELNLMIFKMRRQVKRGDGDALPAAFIEFESQEAAQAAHQVVAHHRPFQISPRILGVRPDEVVWSSLRMKWWERVIRHFLIMGVITVAIVFWSVPSAIIGIVSNVEFLSKNIIFLKWITKLPKPILGFLQGFVPAMALSWWMALVPWMVRICAVQAGIPSYVLVELFTQRAYFIFQVIQVFLITTLTSAASAAIFDIIKDPMSAKDLLAQNLPKASNFYLSYILIQCVVNGATGLLHVFELLRHEVFGNVSQIPRSRFNVWWNLRPPRWGGVYPVFSNLAVIAFSYTCIAPLILLFACAGMAFVRMVYRYNVMYVLDSEMDSKGLFYPQALLHLIVGLYMAEICMIGLFALKFAFAPMLLMIIFAVFTALVHISLSDAIEPLLQNLPQTLPLEEEIQQQDKAAVSATMQAAADLEATPGGGANDYYDMNQNFGEEEPEFPEEEEETPQQTERALEGAEGIGSAVGEFLKSSTNNKMDAFADRIGFTKALNFLTSKLGLAHQPNEPPNFFLRWLHPEIYEDFVALRKMIPFDSLPNREYQEDGDMCNYWPPELWMPKPILWIPRDEARVSRQEVAHTKKITPITDLGVSLNEKGLLIVDVEAAPFKRSRLLY